MYYFFDIKVECKDGVYSASALGRQGEWARGLNNALENLLNQIVLMGIESRLQTYEPYKENAPNAEGPGAGRSASFGKTKPKTGKKTGKNKLKS